LPIYAYGLDRLADVKQGDAVLVVEGESDCHAAWLHGFNAIGVPGATTWKREWKEFLEGLQVYVWEEPDQGGPELVKRIVADFPKARIISGSLAGAKDLADLHRSKGSAFPAVLREFMASALPAGVARPPIAFDVLLGDRIAALAESKSKPIDAVPMPWPMWNSICCGAGGRRGLARGWHVIAAAKTGSGKSILALNVAVSAMRAGERVCFISLEMSQEEVETRLLAIASDKEVAQLEQGDELDIPALRSAGEYLAALYERTGGCFYTNREPIHRLPDVLDSIRFNHEVHGCRFFIVDYLQLAGNPMKPETIVAVSNAVRRLTVQLQVTTFGLSQFNRQTSASKERPTKEGLMGGSALENDATQVLIIDHSRWERAAVPYLWHSYAIVDKNRHGPARDIPIEFNTRTLRIRERLVVRESD
jgi:KaiC/GvpD/RAD55 family RecA-like ATPase